MLDQTVLIASFVGALLGAVLALGAAWRERHSRVIWAFAAGFLLLAAESACNGLMHQGNDPAQRTFWLNLRFGFTSLLPLTWLTFSLTYARGNRMEYIRKWRNSLIALAALPWLLLVGFWGEFGNVIPAQPADEASILVVELALPGILVHLLLLVGAVLILMQFERTYRAAVGTMRWQIKYLLMGLGALFVVRLYTSSQIVLYRTAPASMEAVDAFALIGCCLLASRSLWRSGVFKVDVYPSHTVLQTSVTVLLAGVYLLIVGVLAKVVSVLGGDRAFPIKALLVLVALVLLTILLMSDRVREHTRRFISRHFRRPHYDYRMVWKVFTQRTAGLLDAHQISRKVVDWLAETFTLLSATLWLVDSNRRTLIFGASTSITDDAARKLMSNSPDALALLESLQHQTEPIDLETAEGAWAETLRKFNPIFFPEGGGRMVVPVRSGSQTVGVLVLGDRVNGIPFSLEDLDLLRCISDQLAAHLNSVQLSRQLLQAKEMEAFQTISTFFVHDLKNTASTLSLMVQNIPAHFHDPAFREDALKALSKSVQRMNDLIGRLGLLRQKLEMKFVTGDLNEMVGMVVSNLEMAHQLPLQKNFRPLPPVRLDPEQMQKVVTNLLLNAKDASDQAGSTGIRVETAPEGPWAVLTVADSGCGMTSEFMERQLFRPFQTTKKKGIGIGMFHSRMIVDAHQGRIEVQSVPGSGTTFRVLLPIDTKPAPHS